MKIKNFFLLIDSGKNTKYEPIKIIIKGGNKSKILSIKTVEKIILLLKPVLYPKKYACIKSPILNGNILLTAWPTQVDSKKFITGISPFCKIIFHLKLLSIRAIKPKKIPRKI